MIPCCTTKLTLYLQILTSSSSQTHTRSHIEKAGKCFRSLNVHMVCLPRDHTITWSSRHRVPSRRDLHRFPCHRPAMVFCHIHQPRSRIRCLRFDINSCFSLDFVVSLDFDDRPQSLGMCCIESLFSMLARYFDLL